MSLEVTEEGDLQQLPRLSLPTGLCTFPAVINPTSLPQQVSGLTNPEHVIESCILPADTFVVEQIEYPTLHATDEEYVEIRVHPHINEQQQQQQVEDNWMQNVNATNPQNFS